jgi:hypothetical protein
MQAKRALESGLALRSQTPGSQQTAVQLQHCACQQQLRQRRRRLDEKRRQHLEQQLRRQHLAMQKLRKGTSTTWVIWRLIAVM